MGNPWRKGSMFFLIIGSGIFTTTTRKKYKVNERLYHIAPEAPKTRQNPWTSHVKLKLLPTAPQVDPWGMGAIEKAWLREWKISKKLVKKWGGGKCLSIWCWNVWYLILIIMVNEAKKYRRPVTTGVTMSDFSWARFNRNSVCWLPYLEGAERLLSLFFFW